MSRAKVLFVLTRPSLRRAYDTLFRHLGRFHSLAVPLLAALTPDQFEVEILDQDDQRVFANNADIVALSFMTSHAKEAYSVADRLRAQGKTVVVGGIHPSAMPQEAKGHADAVAVGEGEQTWPRILDDFVNGRLQPFYLQREPVSLSASPIPRHDLMPRFTSKRLIAPVQTTRGCPFDCEFCSITSVFGRQYRTRDVSLTLSEIQNTDADLYVMVDDNIAANRKFAAELFLQLTPLNKRWLSQCDISIAANDELLTLAARSGCVALLFGLETLAQTELTSLGKHISPSSQYEHLLRNVHKHGIMAVGSFILGLDGQTKGVFEKTVSFARQVGLAYAYMPILTPYPGTRLNARLQSEGRIFHSDWSRYNGSNVVFQPRGMSPEELAVGWEWAKAEIASFSSILQRLRVAPVQLRYNVPLNLGYYVQTRARAMLRRLNGNSSETPEL
jgi:radical SAM superfamily enzyme YgiQ (UPF0313 family)